MMKHRSWWLAAMIAISAVKAGAQTPSRYSAELTLSGGHDQGGEYLEGVRDLHGARASISARRWATAQSGFFGELSVETLKYSQHYDSSCDRPKSGIGCLKPFPIFAGTALTVGVIRAPSSRSELRAGLGGAWYHADTGAMAHTMALLAHLDAAWYVVSHVALTTGVRGTLVPSFRDERLTAWVVTVGLRAR
jgi:hypothetical protein